MYIIFDGKELGKAPPDLVDMATMKMKRRSKWRETQKSHKRSKSIGGTKKNN